MKSILRRTIVLALFFTYYATTFAQTQVLTVWQRDGQKIYYDLEEHPKTYFSESNIVIETTTVTATYPLDKIQRYTYETMPTGINETRAEYNSVRISQENGAFKFYGLKPGTNISIYTSDGCLISSQKAESAVPTMVSVNSLPQGVYLVTANDINYKIYKR